MNPWTILATVLLWAASLAATGAWFYGAGQDAELASQAKLDQARQETRALAADAAASAIASIKVEHRIVQGRIERVTLREVRYTDCRHATGVVDDINRALTGSRAPASQPGNGSRPSSAPSNDASPTPQVSPARAHP